MEGFVNMALYLWAPKNPERFVTSQRTVNFTIGSVLHSVSSPQSAI